MTPTRESQSGLFSQLQPLLAHRAVLITVSKLEGDLSTSVVRSEMEPAVDQISRAELGMPLTVTTREVEVAV